MKHEFSDKKCISNAFTLVIMTFFMLEAPLTTRAAVFEQQEDGIINPMRDGAPEVAPSALPKGVGNRPMDPVAPTESVLRAGVPGGAVILDAPADVSELPNSISVLPTPRELTNDLSSEQRNMRRMATEVALIYSRRPEVVRAQLDQATFVNIFTTMIRRESNFNPRAVSPVGAKGLGQLMPLTARELGVCDVFSPRDNLEGAATYFTSMLDKFASAPIALAAYNAGPGAVTKHGGIPPFRETRQYVADIMAAVRVPTDTVPDAIVDFLSYNPTHGAGPSGLLSIERGATRIRASPC